MNYFKGSRRRGRRARKSTSLLVNNNDNVTLETENTSSGQQAADSPENDKTQGKRSRDADKTESETNITSGSKKRKAQHPRSKSYEASSSRTQTGKNKSTRKATKQDKSQQDESLLPAAEQSNIQLDQSDQLSRSKSEENLNSSDKRDSLILCDTNEQQSDRNFLQQQIKIIKTPFQLEDCPALAKIRANDSKHIPFDVIHNTLRKVNHKTEDKVLRSLNRPTQRKLLNDLQGTRPEGQDPKATCVSDEQLLETYKEVQARVTNLEKVHDEIQQQHTQYKHIGALVSQLEAVSEEFSSKKLTEAVKRTSTLNLGQRAGLSLSDDTPRTHQQLVQILFKD